MKNKAFTIIELLAVLVILGVIASITVVGMSNSVNNSRKKAYEAHEETLKRAAQSYLLENDTEMPDTAGTTKRVNASTLYSAGYIEILEDPVNKNDCNTNSYVIVTRENNVGYNVNLSYKVCLKCSKYTSPGC